MREKKRKNIKKEKRKINCQNEASLTRSNQRIIYHKSNDEISIRHMSEMENVRGVRNRFAIAYTLLSQASVIARTPVVILPDKLHFYPKLSSSDTLS